MKIQEDVALANNEKKIGCHYRVLIDRREGDYWIARTEFDSPEVDPEVLIESSAPLVVGNFYEIEVTSVDQWDIYGKIL